MAPVVEGSSPFTHPKAPVAQLDRASDFESAGRPFEPDRARHAPHRVHGCHELDVVQGANNKPFKLNPSLPPFSKGRRSVSPF